jgi:hypothetical protein
MTRLVWSVSAVLVSGRLVADVLDPCAELSPGRVMTLLVVGLVVAAILGSFLRQRGDE